MAVYQRMEVVDKTGTLHVFTQHSWHTEYEAFNHGKNMSAKEILALPEADRHSWEYLRDLNQSVTMPTISRLGRKVRYETLPGLSGLGNYRKVTIGRVKAVRSTNG